MCFAFLRVLGVSGAAAIAGMFVSVGAQASTTRLAPDSLETVKAALSAVSLSDRENGEILGTAFDLVERPDTPERRAAAEPGEAAHRLAVILAPGALDKLRRASEFRRAEPAADAAGTRPAFVYVRDEPPAIRVIVTVAPIKAIIEVSRRP
ncbi:MAG: hypothetical protein AB7H81_12055 [Vicinamibacterales bacterium]